MKTKITILIGLFACFNMFGQVKESEIKLRDKGGNPKLIEFKETKISNQNESIQEFLKQQFKTSENVEFRTKSNTLEKKQNRFESQKLQQYYKGIKVEHGRLNAISKNGNLSRVVGRYVSVENLNITPNLTEEQALEFTLKHINAEKYIWEDEGNEQFLKNEQNNQSATFYPKGELVIIESNPYSENKVPRLAYKFNVYALKPISRAYYYIDAINGNFIRKRTILKHVEGTAHTLYSGTRTIETEQVGSQFRLRDNTRGNGIQTFNMNNGGSYSAATDLIDNNNNWTLSEYNNAEKEIALLDAHWGAINTYDYFFNEHGRNSIDDNGFLLRNYVNGDTFNIAGIGKTKAAQIVYRAQTVYFNDSFLTYADARVYTLQAAEDLFGANSPEAIQTCQSWYVVGVGDNECIQNFDIVGVDQLCGTQNATYTIPNLPSGSNVNWSVNYALTILSSNNSSITVKPKYTSTNGFGVITANINGVIQRKSIFIGRPSFTVPITQDTNWVTANLKYGSTNLNIESQGITNIQWQKVSGNGSMVLSYDTNNNPISATIHGPGGSTGWSFRGKVTITNSCGSIVRYFNADRAGSGGNNCPRCEADGPIPFSGASGLSDNQSKIEIYPNPVDNILKVNLMNSGKGFVKIYNLQGKLMQEVEITSKQPELNMSNLQNGIYFVDVNEDNTRTTQKIIVQH